MGTTDGSSVGLPVEGLIKELPDETPEAPGVVLPEYLQTEDGVLRDIIDLRIRGKEISIRGAASGRPEHAEWAHILHRVAANLVQVLEEHNPDLLAKLVETEDHTNRGGTRQIL